MCLSYMLKILFVKIGFLISAWLDTDQANRPKNHLITYSSRLLKAVSKDDVHQSQHH